MAAIAARKRTSQKVRLVPQAVIALDHNKVIAAQLGAAFCPSLVTAVRCFDEVVWCGLIYCPADHLNLTPATVNPQNLPKFRRSAASGIPSISAAGPLITLGREPTSA
jgi:hypothetical protein